MTKKMLLIYIKILLSMLIEHYQYPESIALPLLHTPECHKTNHDKSFGRHRATTQLKQQSLTKP